MCIPCLGAKNIPKTPLPYYVDNLLRTLNIHFLLHLILLPIQLFYTPISSKNNQIKILNHRNINEYYHINRDKNINSAFKLIDTNTIK